jgi:hypothetical protein
MKKPKVDEEKASKSEETRRPLLLIWEDDGEETKFFLSPDSVSTKERELLDSVIKALKDNKFQGEEMVAKSYCIAMLLGEIDEIWFEDHWEDQGRGDNVKKLIEEMNFPFRKWMQMGMDWMQQQVYLEGVDICWLQAEMLHNTPL